MRHLDDDAVRLIEAGDAEARAYFAAHLSAPCEVCETYLVGAEGPGMLGAAADAALAARSGDADAPLDEVGFRRVRRGLKGARTAARPEWRVRVIAMGGIAAALIAVFAVLFSRPASQDSELGPGIKGAARALTLELQAAHQSGAGALRRVDSGEVLPASGALVFRYSATERGGGWLFVRRGDRVETLGAFGLEPGTHPLRMQNGDAASLPLDQEAGELIFYLVGAAGRSPTLDEAQQAIEDPRSSRLATTRLEVRVGPPRR
jgi:hypothetical protein